MIVMLDFSAKIQIVLQLLEQGLHASLENNLQIQLINADIMHIVLKMLQVILFVFLLSLKKTAMSFSIFQKFLKFVDLDTLDLKTGKNL